MQITLIASSSAFPLTVFSNAFLQAQLYGAQDLTRDSVVSGQFPPFAKRL